MITPDDVRRHPTLGRAVTPRRTSYIPHRPTPPQAAFLVLSGKEAFYGGAAGGGKSEALLMAALQFVDLSAYAALIVRRTFQMLDQPGGLMSRARDWLGPTDAMWAESNHQWVFPSGATLTFRHLQDSGDELNFQGAEYQFIGVDEVTDLTEGQYRFLFSRLRRLAGCPVPVRMRSASNPHGPGLEWVHRRFVLEGPAHGRAFIPARLDDNPYLDREEYERALHELDPVTRRQLRDGDWTARPEGGLFRRAWFAERFTDRRAIPPASALCRYWDLAATEASRRRDADSTAGVLLARSKGGAYYVVEVTRARSSPRAVEELVRSTAERDRDWAAEAGMGALSIRMEQEPGSAGATVIDHYRREVLDGFDFAADRPTGDKRTRALPLVGRAEAGDLWVCRGAWNTEFLDELCAFPEGRHDDQVDALAGAFTFLAEHRRPCYLAVPAMDDEPSYWRQADPDWTRWG